MPDVGSLKKLKTPKELAKLAEMESNARGRCTTSSMAQNPTRTHHPYPRWSSANWMFWELVSLRDLSKPKQTEKPRTKGRMTRVKGRRESVELVVVFHGPGLGVDLRNLLVEVRQQEKPEYMIQGVAGEVWWLARSPLWKDSSRRPATRHNHHHHEKFCCFWLSVDRTYPTCYFSIEK